jgi:hypothetical protein
MVFWVLAPVECYCTFLQVFFSSHPLYDQTQECWCCIFLTLLRRTLMYANFTFFSLENMATVNPFFLCRNFTVLSGAAKWWKSVKNKNNCQNSPLVSQSHLALLEVKQLAEFCFSPSDTCKILFFLVIQYPLAFTWIFLRETNGHLISQNAFCRFARKIYTG